MYPFFKQFLNVKKRKRNTFEIDIKKVTNKYARNKRKRNKKFPKQTWKNFSHLKRLHKIPVKIRLPQRKEETVNPRLYTSG